MAETRLVGGPCDGEMADVEAGQVEVVQDGCTYRHQERDGFYVYVEGEKAAKAARKPSRTRLGAED